MSAKTPKLSESDSIQALRVRHRLAELGVTVEQIATALRASSGSIANTINGYNSAARSRGQITDVVGVRLWDGIEPQPRGIAPTLHERSLVDDVFAKCERLRGRLEKAGDDSARAAIRAEAAALFTPDFTLALAKCSQFWTAADMIREAGAIGAFQAELLRAYGEEPPAPTPKGQPIKIKLSA